MSALDKRRLSSSLPRWSLSLKASMELYVFSCASVDSGLSETLDYRSHTRTDLILVVFLEIKIPPQPPDLASRPVVFSSFGSRRLHYRREEDRRKMKKEDSDDG